MARSLHLNIFLSKYVTLSFLWRKFEDFSLFLLPITSTFYISNCNPVKIGFSIACSQYEVYIRLFYGKGGKCTCLFIHKNDKIFLFKIVKTTRTSDTILHVLIRLLHWNISETIYFGNFPLRKLCSSKFCLTWTEFESTKVEYFADKYQYGGISEGLLMRQIIEMKWKYIIQRIIIYALASGRLWDAWVNIIWMKQLVNTVQYNYKGDYWKFCTPIGDCRVIITSCTTWIKDLLQNHFDKTRGALHIATHQNAHLS